MQIETKVPIREINGNEIDSTVNIVLTVKSHWNEKQSVVLVDEGGRTAIKVNAAELIKAIHNATNW